MNRRLSRAGATLAGLLLASAALGADVGRCGEDPRQYLCTGESNFASFDPAIEPLLPTGEAAVTLRAGFHTQPLGAEGVCRKVLLWDRSPIVQGGRIELRVRRVADVCLGPGPAGATDHVLTWQLGTLAPRVYAVELQLIPARITMARYRFEVLPSSPALSLAGGDFVATVALGEPPRAASAVALTDQSGYFSFFSASNIEVTLKILDGRAVNGHYWVFAASMTDRPFTLTIFDNRSRCLDLPTDPRQACPFEDYVASAGENRNFIDTAAFPAGE